MESDKCDMCKDRLKVLWVAGRYTTDDLPTQDLGHIQHTCEAFSDLHTAAHHRCWRLIHGDLSRLAFFRTRQYNYVVRYSCCCQFAQYYVYGFIMCT
jgi:hypothetical protein